MKRKKIYALLLVLVMLVLVGCGGRSEAQSPQANNNSTTEAGRANNASGDVIDTLDELTNEQLICDSNGIKIWMMNLSIDNGYGEPYWVVQCYMENDSGHPLHTQLDNIAVNGEYAADFRGVNNDANLLDGQKGTFIIHLPASDLDFYGIEKISRLSGVVWIIDEDTWDCIIDHAPFDVFVDDIGNIYNNESVATEPIDAPNQETTVPDAQYEIRLGYAEAAKLFDKEFENFETLIDEVGYTISYYSDCSFATIDEIKTYESMWQDLSDDANAISSSLTAKLPPKEYEDIWNAYVSCINQLATIFAKGNDLDVNHDGTYTGDELQNVTLEIGYEFVDISNEAVELTKELKTLSETIAASSQNPTDNNEKIDSDNNNANTPFTNKYGTPTTRCAHTGCYNYIANSGDTNCCKEHSNRCLDCNKYIDEDAYWCVSCIAAAATPTCEACGKDATHTITGITGQTEYYCTEHYNEMKDLLEWMENN